MANLLRIEKCFKEEKIIQKQIAFLRRDLTRAVFKISYGIRYFFDDKTIKEEYYDFVYKECLQDGVTYYPNEECNSYEEISSIAHVAANRDKVFDELLGKLEKGSL